MVAGSAILLRAAGPTGPAAIAALSDRPAVALLDADLEALTPAAARLTAAGADVAVRPLPADDAAIAALVAEIASTLGPPRVLVSGLPPLPPHGPSTDLASAGLAAAVADTVSLPFAWARAVYPRMTEAGGGVIVNVARLSGLGGWPGWAADAAAMAALINLTHTLAAEWTGSGVRVNTVVAGATPALAAALGPAEGTRVERRIPLRRWPTDEDVANAIAYLIDPGSSYVSGEVLRVDGGWEAWGRLNAVAAR
jgi:NAD(P)-dependent dehydrogenase (short-subunit alcohol dehydrogenase family)